MMTELSWEQVQTCKKAERQITLGESMVNDGINALYALSNTLTDAEQERVPLWSMVHDMAESASQAGNELQGVEVGLFFLRGKDVYEDGQMGQLRRCYLKFNGVTDAVDDARRHTLFAFDRLKDIADAGVERKQMTEWQKRLTAINRELVELGAEMDGWMVSTYFQHGELEVEDG